jgi:hypothetical protein
MFVTADDALPSVHADAIEAVQETVVTMNHTVELGWALTSLRRRWANVIQDQSASSIRRYHVLRRHAAWQSRVRRRSPPTGGGAS